jgi:hypothetical protein
MLGGHAGRWTSQTGLERLKVSVRTTRQIIAGCEPRWSGKLGLNVTGAAADPARKARDLYKRGHLTSRPVLHMAHALNECAYEFGPRVPRWGERDPVIAMLLNADLWIWEALAIAERWRLRAGLDLGLGLGAEDMIAIVSPREVEGRIGIAGPAVYVQSPPPFGMQ